MGLIGLLSVSEMILSNFLWLVLLIVGFTLVVVEIYLPGFGVPGILGGSCLIAGIALYAKGDVFTWLVMVIIIVGLLCVVMSMSIRSAGKGRLSKSKMVLNEVVVPVDEKNDLDFFLGKRGCVRTTLRPAGTAEFDGVRLNVLSDGEYIKEGESVEVTRVEGNRIFVRKLENA